MTLLHILSYVGVAAAFVFVILSLASGLLWLSELIEEHSRVAKIVGQRGIYAIIVVHTFLCFYDNLPWKRTLFSILCHYVYLQNFTPNWPSISLTSLSFIASCVLVILDHFLWFFYFAQITQDARIRAHRAYRGPAPTQAAPGFVDIATFFGVCVWLAPLFLFLSLSANDNTLPVNLNRSSVPNTPTSPTHERHIQSIRTRASLFRTIFDHLPRLRPRSMRHDTTEGLIAPRSPGVIPASPSRSPTTLHRVPSFSNIPPPLLSPARRVSSDHATRFTPAPMQSRNSVDEESSAFKLAPPPRRTSTGTGTSVRDVSSGRTLEMRRTTSAYAKTESDSGLS